MILGRRKLNFVKSLGSFGRFWRFLRLMYIKKFRMCVDCFLREVCLWVDGGVQGW